MHFRLSFGLFLCIIFLNFSLSGCAPGISEAPCENSPAAPSPSPAPLSTNTPPPIKDSVHPTPQTAPAKTASPTPTVRPSAWIFPDAEVVYSPAALGFNTNSYLNCAAGYLAAHEQYLMITGWTKAADVIQRVAIENSINPRLLLALLEYQSGWVFGQPEDADAVHTFMGASNYYRKDLYGQLIWTVHTLSEGFYGWQTETLTELTFPDGSARNPTPEINAGTFALHHFFAQFHAGEAWEKDLDPETGFPALYSRMFGDPWARVAAVNPLLPEDLVQPELPLPFEPGVTWTFTGGPHAAFEGNGPLAALDFAPPMKECGCQPSPAWVTAVADGLVVRSELGVVIQDLDGDGFEQTGWAILYLHIDDDGRAPKGTFLHVGERVGHPSCKGGRATGTHLHIARKYNGVWLAADGEIPFVLGGWRASAGDEPYLGTLSRNGVIVTANQFGPLCSCIQKEEAPGKENPSQITYR